MFLVFMRTGVTTGEIGRDRRLKDDRNQKLKGVESKGF